MQAQTLGNTSGEGVGSGNFGTPWVRMHYANVSAAAFSAAVGGVHGVVDPRIFWQACCAAWKAGDDGLMAPTRWNWKPPPCEPGSGKSDTPCERMHWANFRRHR